MAKLERRAVTRDNLTAPLAIKVGDSQRGLVADNAVTLAQAPFEPGSCVWGLWAGDTAVALMAMVNLSQYPFLEPGDDPASAYLWRLMITADQQGKGHGRNALDLAVEQARDWGPPRLTAHVVDRPDSGPGFCERYGVRRNGRVVDGEVEMVLDGAGRGLVTRI